MSQQPSVGRFVHYVSYGTPGGEFTSECRAAVITEVQPAFKGQRAVIDVERVGLAVFNPSGLFFHTLADGGCRQSEDNHAGGTWHWPEQVGPWKGSEPVRDEGME